VTDDPLDQLAQALATPVEDPNAARRKDLRRRLYTFAELAAVKTQSAEPLLGPLIRRQWRTLLVGHSGEGKAEHLDNQIYTPDGWRRFGDLAPGDRVFGDDGRPCNVVAVSPVWPDRDLYRVTSKDGASWVVDAAHEWMLSSGEMIETREMARRCHEQSRRLAVNLHGPLQMPEADLPIDPYLLGVWLGDGSSSQATLHLCSPEKMEHVGGRVRDRAPVYEYRVRRDGKAIGVRGGFLKDLRELGLLGAKRIPRSYLLASLEQRLELLRGLIDTDGHVSERGQVEIVSKDKELAEDIAELVRSMGVRVGFTHGPATIDGRYIYEKWRVRFRMAGCATWGRRAERARDAMKYAAHYLWAEPLGTTGPTRCIQVDSPTHLYLSGPEMVPTHNTTFTTRMVGALVTGGKFLGYQATQCRVLVVDVEQDEAMCQERIGETMLGTSFNGDTLAEAMAAIPEAHNAFYCQWMEGIALDEQTADREELRAIIEEIKPDVVVIDPLYKTFLGNPNEPVLATQVMRFLDAMREEHGFALVIPMHPRKEQQGVQTRRLTKHDAYGGGGWIWGAEMILGIERMPGNSARLSFFKDRSGTVDNDTVWHLAYDKGTGFTRVRTSEPGAPTTTEESILVALRDRAGEFFDRVAIQEMCPGKEERTVRNALMEIKRGKERGKYPRLVLKRGARGSIHYGWSKPTTASERVQDLDRLVVDIFEADREEDDL